MLSAAVDRALAVIAEVRRRMASAVLTASNALRMRLGSGCGTPRFVAGGGTGPRSPIFALASGDAFRSSGSGLAPDLYSLTCWKYLASDSSRALDRHGSGGCVGGRGLFD